MSEDLEATDQCVSVRTLSMLRHSSREDSLQRASSAGGHSVVSHTSESQEGFGDLWIAELTSAAPPECYMCQTQQLMFLESSGGGC